MAQEHLAPTVHMLACELVDVVTKLDEFRKPGYYIYNMQDLARQTELGSQYPMVAVAWEGVSEVADMRGARPHSGSKFCAPGAMMATQLFTVVVGVEYYAAGNDDTKPCATDLLDSIRKQLLGFKGVNARPWILQSEQPLGGDMSEGVLWYGQQWATDVVYMGEPQT